MYQKLKSFLADDAFFFSILLIMVGIVSFGLGRQSMVEVSSKVALNQPSGVIFTEAALPNVINTQDNVKVVASRSGTKYHLLNCPGANQIKDENKVYFDSPELALAAGYTPASNCPGLKQ